MSARPLLLALVTFGLGFAAARALQPAPSAEPLSPAMREKLQQLSSVDLEEYARLKDGAQKFEKANEILGKIMQIFLADLGLHVSSQAQQAAAEKPASPAPPPREPAPAAPAKKTEVLTSPDSPEAPLERNPRWRKVEQNLPDVRSGTEANTFLRHTSIRDFGATLQHSRTFSNNSHVLERLNGRFSGSSRVTYDGKKHAWDFQLELNAKELDHEANGDYHLVIYGGTNPRPLHDSRESGELRSLREPEQGGSAVLLRVSKNLYLQAYYLPALDAVAANIYRRANEQQPFADIGNVTLHRK